MSTKNTQITAEIQKLSGVYLTSLKSDTSTNNSYVELFNRIHSLISVCQTALLSQDAINHPHTNLDLANLLELASGLMPLSEAEFLDEMQKLVPAEKK